MTRGVVAAGHLLTAEAGASALRVGGNAVDAALAAMCASFVCEPLLTGLGAGGYMLVGAPGGEDVLLDFFVEAHGRGDPPRRPPGRRLPSMMAPTLARRADGAVELALGSAGSNRIRSAILQVISNVVDGGMGLAEAVEAPRLHWEDGVLYVEPGAEPANLEGIVIARFNGPNVFFGGCQAVRRDPDSGRMVGAGDPRRGGAVIAV
jgi:gamma-glutamyltranspeptidase